MLDKSNSVLSQGSGLVGRQDINGSESRNGIKPLDEDAAFSHLGRAFSHIDAYYHRQELRGDADRDRQREQEGIQYSFMHDRVY